MTTSLATQDSSPTLSGNMVQQFIEQGFLNPIQVLSTQACQHFLREADDPAHPPPIDWFKGYAANSPAFYNIGTNPKILEVVRSLLGEDVMLWGAQVVNRAPNSMHPWHTDIEASDPSCKTVSVWIGLKHTNSESSLTVVPYSHRFGKTLQEVRGQFGKSRGETKNHHVECWAQSYHPKSSLMRPLMADGDALFFDGRLWHASHNFFHETRRALILQYATADTEIRIPDYNYLDWPCQFLPQPLPPCLLVSGSDHTGANRFVQPPGAKEKKIRPPLTSKIYPLPIPLPPADNQFWQPHPLFRGSTPNMPDLSCHVSVLHQGHQPHPPHTHKDEELLLLLAGEIDVLLPDAPGLTEDHRIRLQPGQFAYYPAGFPHTLETVSAMPANYLMLKWQAPSTRTEALLSFCHFSIFDALATHADKDGFSARRLFESPTAYLHKLHCHTSTLTPGAGYEVHCDAHDITIIVLKGELETLEERVGPHGVIFYRAGEPHGMFNPGKDTAHYVVFEFHSGDC